MILNNGRIVPAILLVFLLTTLANGSTAQDQLVPASFQIKGVPFIKQKSEFCGPASLSSVMTFYGMNISQDEIAKKVYTEKLNGALITDLENFAISKKFKTKLDTGSLESIKTHISKNNPVIILLDVGFWIFTRPHYIVAFGYNKEGIIVHNGYSASITIDYKDFAGKWKKMGNVLLVVYR